MKVEGNNNILFNLYKKNIAAANNNNISVSKTSDRLEISSLGKEISKYIDETKNKEITNEKIEEIKSKMKDGSYTVNERELAKSILNHIKRGV